MKKKEFIPALGHNWLTSFYDVTIKLTMPERKFRTLLIDKLDPKNGEAILEFGYGTGQNIILAHQRNENADLRGIDVDPKVKEIAEHKLNKLGLDMNLDLYDGLVFPYANDSFDKVFSSLVFHQLDRKNKLLLLKEIYRVLKPNGKLIIGDWGKAKNKIMRFTFYFVQILDGFKTTEDNVKGLLPEFIKQSGFKKVSETSFINTAIGTYSYYETKK